MKTRMARTTLCIVIVLLSAGLCCAEKTPETDDSSTSDTYLAQPGVPGVCRGMLHMISAPLMIPYGFAYGVSMPFRTDPEQAGTTNYVAYAATQTIATPLSIAANSGVGAGGCCREFLTGLMDVLSCGYYDLPDASRPEQYDTRPYFLQALSRMGRGEPSFFTGITPPSSTKTAARALSPETGNYPVLSRATE